MKVDVITGNLFNSRCQTLVNTVNCEGVMGAGIALEFRLRHPSMFRRYVEICKAGQLDIGKLWLYKPEPQHRVIDRRWVLNFPTKRRWRFPSRIEYLEQGLKNFVETYEKRGIQSIAFPLLGAANGRLDEERSMEIMSEYLSQCDIPVEIYQFDPDSDDELYNQFREKLLEEDVSDVAAKIRTRKPQVSKIFNAFHERDDIKLASHLTKVKGVGFESVEKLVKLYINDRVQIESRHTPIEHSEWSGSQASFTDWMDQKQALHAGVESS